VVGEKEGALLQEKRCQLTPLLMERAKMITNEFVRYYGVPSMDYRSRFYSLRNKSPEC
jgi:hypothetical protein